MGGGDKFSLFGVFPLCTECVHPYVNSVLFLLFYLIVNLRGLFDFLHCLQCPVLEYIILG